MTGISREPREFLFGLEVDLPVLKYLAAGPENQCLTMRDTSFGDLKFSFAAHRWKC